MVRDGARWCEVVQARVEGEPGQQPELGRVRVQGERFTRVTVPQWSDHLE